MLTVYTSLKHILLFIFSYFKLITIHHGIYIFINKNLWLKWKFFSLQGCTWLHDNKCLWESMKWSEGKVSVQLTIHSASPETGYFVFTRPTQQWLMLWQPLISSYYSARKLRGYWSLSFTVSPWLVHYPLTLGAPFSKSLFYL